ncbi:hypothetical protein B0H13DRAFT_1935229 [Mycena leptocephala]|nr:hypothetical protein B0H13DRAFT_1935229 [Mycena leptocephala]
MATSGHELCLHWVMGSVTPKRRHRKGIKLPDGGSALVWFENIEQCLIQGTSPVWFIRMISRAEFRLLSVVTKLNLKERTEAEGTSLSCFPKFLFIQLQTLDIVFALDVAKSRETQVYQKTNWLRNTFAPYSESEEPDVYDYSHRPLLAANLNFERSTALLCQCFLIDSTPEIVYNIAPASDKTFRFKIKDSDLNVSFRRVRDKALLMHSSECIAVLAQTLVEAVTSERLRTDLNVHVNEVYKQLEEEFCIHDLSDLVCRLEEEQRKLDPSQYFRTALQLLHHANLIKRGPSFWKALENISHV